MNTKIYPLLLENLKTAFKLQRYNNLSFDKDTVIENLPWTPVRYRKFKDAIEQELQLSSDFKGTIGNIVEDFDRRYSHRFFGEIWKPRTQDYTYSGWALEQQINSQNPQNVLDVGCGYNPFKGRIKNLIGIDPYNNCADYQVDILDYIVQPESHDHILALGSINFNSIDEIENRFSHCVNLLMKGGKFYIRANPGIQHESGPYVDIFPWSFKVANDFAVKYGLHLDTFKQDNCERLYFSYTKLRDNI